MSRIFAELMIVVLAASTALAGNTEVRSHMKRPQWINTSIKKLEKQLTGKYGGSEAARIKRGLKQVGDFWRDEDGDQNVFEEFVVKNFAGDKATRHQLFDRFENLLEQLDGHMNEITLKFRARVDLDAGPVLPFDEIFAGYSPSAHVLEDFFKNKLAFVVLLNFPLTTLEERIEKGPEWTRIQWAEARLAERFSKRIPADVKMDVAEAASEADQYVSAYNIWMHHLLDNEGRRLFPPKMRLLSHWNLRDEIKACYNEGKEGLPKQRIIEKVMERIVEQTIPGQVINNPWVDWNPYTNEVARTKEVDSDEAPPARMEVSDSAEPDTRYAVILKTFRAQREVDPYSPSAPTLIARRFEEDREIPEEHVRRMFEKILSSPLVGGVAELIRKRLGRELEPFDIWYDGFKMRQAYNEEALDSIVGKRYPNAAAYKEDIPNLLGKFGFAEDEARYIAGLISVDPARGSGHAWGPEMRGEKAHLRTRVGRDGMDYKGFNIAVHEMGHNVEQVLSLNKVDHTLLRGVPNTAFTEAIAFVFQNRDLELLGLPSRHDAESDAMRTLDLFWSTYEIAGVALVDMGIWHWMYDHPDATASELKKAVIDISRSIWNEYYAPHFGEKDVVLLAIYSHILNSFLYIPDYPLGFLIAFQIEEHLRNSGNMGREIERMVTFGRVTPDLWMKHATGYPVGPEALLDATARSLEVLVGRK